MIMFENEPLYCLVTPEGGKLNVLYYDTNCDCCLGLAAHIPEMQRRDWNDAIDAVIALYEPDEDGDAYRDPDNVKEKIRALKRKG